MRMFTLYSVLTFWDKVGLIFATLTLAGLGYFFILVNYVSFSVAKKLSIFHR